MQISKISSFNFAGAPKKVISNVAKNVEKKEHSINPMQKYIEETPNFRDFYGPRNLIPKETKPAQNFYSPREVIINCDNSAEAKYMHEIDTLVAQKRNEIKK